MLPRALILCLMIAVPGPGTAQPAPPPAAAPPAFTYHVRISYRDEIWFDRDMVYVAGRSGGEQYSRDWTALNGDACAGPGHPARFATRDISISLFPPAFGVADQVPVHAFLLSVGATVPPTARDRSGACTAHGSAGNGASLSQIVDLAPGGSIALDMEHGVHIEVTRR